MAEMTTPESGAKKKGHKKVRSKKMSTRVDLTAMVDLGFLLITFFMLATTFNKPKAMEVNKPAKDDEIDQKDLPEIKQSKTYTVLIAANDKAYCYTASDDDSGNVSVDSTDFSRTGFRERLRERQKAVATQWGSQDELFVLIKPLPQSDYRNLVNVLDEMAINGVKKYAIIDEFNGPDSLIVKQVGQSFEPAAASN
ncbi:MAG: biopolymer transporter ExbD [Saprospiraceae bacterium]|nr:biopolymer transporter ExbD [Saprospiraceae bacterium]